jgi:hypothetical protein
MAHNYGSSLTQDGSVVVGWTSVPPFFELTSHRFARTTCRNGPSTSDRHYNENHGEDNGFQWTQAKMSPSGMIWRQIAA